MRLLLRIRLVPLAAALLVHALVIGAMLSTLRVGTISMSAVHHAQLERASQVLAVQAFITVCPNCRQAETSHSELNLPGAFHPDLKRLRVFPAVEPQWGASSRGGLRSAASQAGLAGVRCEVHIHQDAHGHLQAIDLGPCTESATWQHALLRRIIQAAALAVPSPVNRAPELTLTVNTNRISTVLLARVLSDPAASAEGGEISAKFATRNRQ
jgi:hypothetical protein